MWALVAGPSSSGASDIYKMRWLVTFSIFLAIISYMADPVWGNLGKAQDNPQTIDEAIAAAIAVHEADSEAHTGVGESLETHKTQEVLDHPAGSVVTDKFSDTELWWQSNMSDYLLWTRNDVHDYDWPGMTVPENATPSTYSYIFVNLANLFNFATPTAYDYYWQAFIFEEHAGTGNIGNFGTGVSSTANDAGMSFRISDDDCYAVFRSDSVEATVQLPDGSFNGAHLYRAFFDSTEQKAYFYIDGVEVASIAKPSGTFNDQPRFGINIYNGTNDYAFLTIFNVIATRAF